MITEDADDEIHAYLMIMGVLTENFNIHIGVNVHTCHLQPRREP